MTVTINEPRTGDDDTVVELTTEEFETAKGNALRRLGFSYEQLAEQARRHDFDSSQALAVWSVIGGPLDQ
ncbi:hypothetical protein [Actinacidiphila sp. ITFR-21]|uniref:hypothetical protein n=1 Tax=Actinacidiphila sp. ITFR-21 TaxID=3075199 RepID=UPI00288BAD1B|nr:hypothetical protein [Streptomyces sp. ITFR-21]WNI19238.1 hypothetical protein RLT57_29285 [Streptomyces sp. ITFR-21]